MKPKRFSVLLLYPEYVAATFGECYYTWVGANDAQSAADEARAEVLRSNPRLEAAPEDFKVLLVLAGEQMSLIQVEGVL